MFLAVVIWLILEGRVAVLHLSPPQGKELEEMTLRLSSAQTRTELFFQNEQPVGISMLERQNFTALLATANVHTAARTEPMARRGETQLF